jgi:hypothetical protein
VKPTSWLGTESTAAYQRAKAPPSTSAATTIGQRRRTSCTTASTSSSSETSSSRPRTVLPGAQLQGVGVPEQPAPAARPPGRQLPKMSAARPMKPRPAVCPSR